MKFGQMLVCLIKAFLKWFRFNAGDWKLVQGPFMILMKLQ